MKTLLNSVLITVVILALLTWSFDVFAEDNPVFYEIVLKGAVSSPTWSSVGTNSITEFSVTSDTVTGGEVIESGYIPVAALPTNVSFAVHDLHSRAPLGSNFDGTAQDELSIVCTGIGGTAVVYAAMHFRERF